MRALTLWRPWCWAIVLGAKPVENRGWKPFDSVLGRRIAIHAGVQYDKQGAAFIDRALIADGHVHRAPASEKWPGGVVVGTVLVQGWITKADRCGVTEDEAKRLRDSRWYQEGAVGWVLREPVRLPQPVLCRGMQSLWELPTRVAEQVLAQERAARAKAESGGRW